MAMINIPSSRDDPNYRYKMPRLMAKVEGRGNGIKTNIVNMAEIARALKRPPIYPTKWFGFELGAQCNWNEKEERAIVNGAHEETELRRLIDKFIEKFVLCPNCQLPEIDLVVKKDTVSCKCNACGHRGELDNAHKLAGFIAKNPPDGSDSTMGKKDSKKSKDGRKAEKAARQRARQQARADGGGDIDEGDEDEEDNESVEDDKKKKKEKEGVDKEKKEKKNEDKEKGEDDEKKEKKEKKKKAKEADEGEKENKEKKKKKKQKDEAVLEKEELSYDSDEIEDVCLRIVSFVRSNPKASDVTSFFAEVRLLQVSQDFSPALRLYVACCGLFPSEDLLASAPVVEGEAVTPAPFDSKGMKSKLAFIKRLLDDTMTPASTLEALEQFAYRHHPESLKPPVSAPNRPPVFSLVVKELYDQDVPHVTEKALLAYYRNGEGVSDESARAYRRAAKAMDKLLTWFEEQSDEDEDSDEDGEGSDESPKNKPLVKSLNLPGGGVGASNAPTSTSPGTPLENKDEEIDIDAI